MAKKVKTVFFCQECGHESSKWMGQCPACKKWNTFVEERVNVTTSGMGGSAKSSVTKDVSVPVELAMISMQAEERMCTGIAELDRVLGGGIMHGSLTLVGGDPGIGKSTLLLQMCRMLANAGRKVLYISGEESLRQIKLRATRIGTFQERMFLLCETNLDLVEEAIRRTQPEVVVIDSIQTMYQEEISAAPGSVSQVREATTIFLQLAKGLDISIFIVGHVTKEGTVAGPRVLEHMVDTVLYFEGDRYASYRVLRAVKNRFGSTNEIGVFEMRKEGLIEVQNPSEYMLSGKPVGASGSVVVCSVEGTRPILIEIQALVCRTNFGIPRRQTTGTDCDAYVNIAGGMKISEPAIDLGLIMAIVSSFKNRAIDERTLVFGEVGLSGEVRAVNMAGQRVQEAKKLGYETVIIPRVNLEGMEKVEGIKVIGVGGIGEAIDLI